MPQDPIPELVLEPRRASKQYWRDLWRYRELFYFLAWRDLLVRYKQTLVGITWAVLRPLLTMLVLTFVFGGLAGMDAGGDVPYPILVLCGMLPWQFFATALTQSGQSLVSNANMVSKIYFPRLVMPASSVITSLVDLAISGVILCLLMVYYQYVPSINVLMLPLFVALAFAAAFGFGLWIAALMVRYRDFRFILPFIVQFGLYVSPVGFQSGVVPDQYRFAYSLNPMVGVIDGFRWSVLGNQLPPDQFRLTAISTPRDADASAAQAVAEHQIVVDVSATDQGTPSNDLRIVVEDPATAVPISSQSLRAAARPADTDGRPDAYLMFIVAEPPKRGSLRLGSDELGAGQIVPLRDLEDGESIYYHADGGQSFYLPGLALSIVLVIVVNYTGVWFFRKTERTFADVI